MLKFENIVFLYGLVLIPIFILIYYLYRKIRNNNLSKFGNKELITILMPNASDYKPIIKFTLLMLSLLFMILGLANLQVGTKIEKIKREGVDIVIAIDVSKSMDAEDIKPSRIERAKRIISKLIDKLNNDRIALIAFAGDAYLQLPLTTDYSAAKLFLEAINTDIPPTQGTAIGASIEMALKLFPKEDKYKKTLIIITDGENHEDDAIEAAKNAAHKGIITHTIGIGTPEGGPIPIYKNGQQVDFLKNEDQSIVVTKLDPVMLEQIATAGQGQFVYAANTNIDLSQIIDKIAGLEKKKIEEKIYSSFESRFQYFFATALILLMIEILLSDNKNKIISSLNLFEKKK